MFVNRIDINESDLITGEKFAHACDSMFFHYDYINRNPVGGNQRVIYADTHKYEELIQQLPPNRNFTLVTHNSDRNADDGMVANLPANVTKWFSQNVCSDSSKVTCLPIGLENNRWFPEISKKAKIVSHSKSSRLPSKLLYVNHAVWTNPSARQPVYDLLQNKSWATCILNSKNGIAFDEYVDSILDHFFIASPNGNGSDCHRTWEVLYLNRVPIVTRNGRQAEAMFEGLPVLLIDSWDQVTEDFLRSKMDYFMTSRFNGFEKLKIDYWLRLIKG